MDSDRDEVRCCIAIVMAMDCDSPGDRGGIFSKLSIMLYKTTKKCNGTSAKYEEATNITDSARDKNLQAQSLSRSATCS